MTTVNDIKTLLAQLPDDQEIVISAYSSHDKQSDNGMYVPLSNVLESFEVTQKQLVRNSQPIDVVAVRLSNDVANIFPDAKDIIGKSNPNMLVSEASRAFDIHFAFDPTYFTSIETLQYALDKLNTEIDNLEDKRQPIIKAINNDEPLSGDTLNNLDEISDAIVQKLKFANLLAKRINLANQNIK